MSFRGKEQSFATGLRTGMYKRGKLPKGASQPPGPAVSSFIDIRKKRGGFMLQDVTVAGAFLPPYVVGSALSSGAMRKPEPFPHGQQWIQMLKVGIVFFIWQMLYSSLHTWKFFVIIFENLKTLELTWI